MSQQRCKWRKSSCCFSGFETLTCNPKCPIKFHGEEGNFLRSIPTHNVQLSIKLEYKQVKDYELRNINCYYFEKNAYPFHTGGIGD